MDARTFNWMADSLDAKISMVNDFIDRAHEEGISTIEAIAMQNHVRREFSPKQRANFRRQIASLYREDRIDIKQKERMSRLLDKASKIADQHFLRLSKIVPESQAMSAPPGFPDFMSQRPGEGGPKRILRWLGIGS